MGGSVDNYSAPVVDPVVETRKKALSYLSNWNTPFIQNGDLGAHRRSMQALTGGLVDDPSAPNGKRLKTLEESARENGASEAEIEAARSGTSVYSKDWDQAVSQKEAEMNPSPSANQGGGDPEAYNAARRKVRRGARSTLGAALTNTPTLLGA